MISKLMYVPTLIAGIVIGVGIQAYAAKPTDVRVGPTATIGVSTNCEGDIVYVANGNGVFKSADGGETWDEIY